MSIRVANLDDIDDVTCIWMRAAGDRDDTTESGRQRTTRDWIEEPARVVYIAELIGTANDSKISNTPVGTAALFLVPDSTDGFINGLAVLPEYQRRGYGRQILSHAVERLIELGRERVMLEVQTDNDGALGLYESVGFERKSTYAYYRVDVSNV